MIRRHSNSVAVNSADSYLNLAACGKGAGMTRRGVRSNAAVSVPEPTCPTGLYVFCGPARVGDREATAAEQAADTLRRGVPALALPNGLDPASVAWPVVPHVAVFAHDDLPDDALHALADALIQAGVSRVTVAGSERRKRGPLLYEVAE